ncbi:MAG: hypothetical protein N4A61_04765 [Pelagimonas sp.]|jgi:hypothetical protein|nr:hypothetical protein [Pelagimonas sp.]
MKAVDQKTFVHPCGDDTPDARRKSAEKLVKALFLECDDDEVVNLVIDAFAGRTSQHKKQVKISAFGGVDKETARRWISGESKPISRAFSQVCLVVMLQAVPVMDQTKFLQDMLGIEL